VLRCRLHLRLLERLLYVSSLSQLCSARAVVVVVPEEES